MGDCVLIAEYINEFNVAVSQLSSFKFNFEDEMRALIILF